MHLKCCLQKGGHCIVDLNVLLIRWPCDSPMMTEIWVNIGSGNGLLSASRYQAITWTDVGISVGFCSIQLRVLTICNMCSEIAILKLLPHLPGVDE